MTLCRISVDIQVNLQNLFFWRGLFGLTVIYSSKRASFLNRNFFSKCSRSRSFSLFPERGLCLRVAVVVLVEVVVSPLQGASLLRGFYFFSLKLQLFMYKTPNCWILKVDLGIMFQKIHIKVFIFQVPFWWRSW